MGDDETKDLRGEDRSRERGVAQVYNEVEEKS